MRYKEKTKDHIQWTPGPNKARTTDKKSYLDKNTKTQVCWFTEVKKKNLAEMKPIKECILNGPIFKKKIKEFWGFQETGMRQTKKHHRAGN